MPAKKPIKASAANASTSTKPAQKTTQPQTKKPSASLESKEPAEAPAAKSRRVEAQEPLRERKLTPQQQMRMDRAKRRKLNQGLGGTFLVLVVLAIIGVLVWRAVGATPSKTASARPTATSAGGPAIPPTVTGTVITTNDKLQYIDVTVGTGPTAKSGDTVDVQYTGWLQSDDVKFDSSYDHSPPSPFEFTLGQGQVIPGWDEGVAGMKVGGKRRLIIPSALGYGAQGSPPQIPANATLIFDVQLVSVNGQTK